MDSDGSVCQRGYLNSKGMVSVSSQASILVYKELAKHVDKFLSNQGIYHRLRFKMTKEGYELVRIYIKGKSTWEFREKIYQDCGMYLKRKRLRLDLDKSSLSLEEAIRLNLNIKGVSKKVSPEVTEKIYTMNKIEGEQ